MRKNTLKKGGIDTIVAYIVVMLPLLYVLIYMVATIFHFSIQMYMNQVVKEALVMASTYGEVNEETSKYINEKLAKVLEADIDGNSVNISYYVKRFNEKDGTVGDIALCTSCDNVNAKKADIIGIKVESEQPSLLGRVGAFNIFGGNSDEAKLKYSSYREEIVRNEPPTR